MKKINKYDPIEQKVKKALDNFEMPYNAADWTAMNAMLNQQHKRKKRRWAFLPMSLTTYTTWGVAAGLMGLLLGWNVLFDNGLPNNEQHGSATSAPTAVRNTEGSEQHLLPSHNNTQQQRQFATAATAKKADQQAAPLNPPTTPQATAPSVARRPTLAQASAPHTNQQQRPTTEGYHQAPIAAAAHNDSQRIWEQQETLTTVSAEPTPPPAATDAVHNPYQQAATQHKAAYQPTHNNLLTPPTIAYNTPSLSAQRAALLLPLERIEQHTVMQANTAPKWLTLPTPNNSLAAANTNSMQTPRKQRWQAGWHTAITQTFSNRSQQRHNNLANGVSVEYHISPRWAVETGAMVGKTNIAIADKMPTNFYELYGQRINQLSATDTEVPLLLKYYFTPNQRTQAYLSAGTAYWSMSGISYDSYTPQIPENCNCSVVSGSDVNNNPTIITDNINAPVLRTNGWDRLQLHAGMQYRLSKRWALQADASIKTHGKKIPIANNAAALLNSPETLGDSYQLNNTAFKIGILYQF